MPPQDLQNQTQFLAEEPFFEQPIPLPTTAVAAKPFVPFFKRRKTIIFLILASTLVLLMIIFVVNLIVERNRKLGLPQQFSLATPSPSPQNTYVLEVEKLRTELKAADPTVLELQPPAVDPTIRLDEKR